MIVLQGERERVEVVRFGPDGATLAAPTYKGVQLWRGLPAPGPPAVLPAHKYARQVAFAADGRLLVAGATFAVYDPATGEDRPVVLWGEYGAVFAVSPDGRSLVAGQNHRGEPKATLGCRRTDDLSPGAAVWTVPVALRIDAGPVFVGPDRVVTGHRYWNPAVGGSDRYVTRDVGTGAVVAEADGPEADGGLLAASPDGRFLAGGRTSRVRVVEAADPRREVAVLQGDGRKHVTGLAFHPSGRFLATAGNDKTVRFWDTASWRPATTFEWGAGRMRSVAFSPDGAVAAAGTDDGRVVVWDVDL